MSSASNRIERGLVLSAGAYAIAGGMLSLLGWGLEIPRLKDWMNDGITMKANTAACALVAGLALVLSQLTPRGKWRIRVLGGVVALVGSLTLLQHLTGWNLGIDTLLFSEAPGAVATAAPNRMGPPASTSFVFLGVALVLTASGARARRWAAALGLASSCVSRHFR